MGLANYLFCQPPCPFRQYWFLQQIHSKWLPHTILESMKLSSCNVHRGLGLGCVCSEFFALSFLLFPLILGEHQVSFLGHGAFPSLYFYFFRMFVRIVETIIGQGAVCHRAVSPPRWYPVFCAVAIHENLSGGQVDVVLHGVATKPQLHGLFRCFEKKLYCLSENRNCVYSV